MNKHDIAQYIQGCLFSASPSTIDKAIKNGNLLGWPAVDDLSFKKLTPTVPNCKGHLDQERKNLQSTRPNDTADAEYVEDIFPTQIDAKTGSCLAMVFPAPEYDGKTGFTYTDQTGRFPFKSSRGHEYIFTLYNYDANCILVKAIKNREAATLLEAWEETHARLTKNGHTTHTHILDNECSGMLKQALTKANLDFQKAPPGQHRRNAAERAIRTFKNHFIAGLT